MRIIIISYNNGSYFLYVECTLTSKHFKIHLHKSQENYDLVTVSLLKFNQNKSELRKYNMMQKIIPNDVPDEMYKHKPVPCQWHWVLYWHMMKVIHGNATATVLSGTWWIRLRNSHLPSHPYRSSCYHDRQNTHNDFDCEVNQIRNQ
jgi:hypothetical protein